MNEKFKSITATTMGDPAGVGPEIVMGTMLDEEVHECCRPFVIGNTTILGRTAETLGKGLRYNKTEDPSGTSFQYGAVDVLEIGDYNADPARREKIQKLAGRTPVDWIMKPIELGMDHKVDAVFIAPTHKRAIKLAGVKRPGHMETYQDGIYSSYALAMSSCHRPRVSFVSRHVSLVDACGYATKERMLEFVRDTDKKLRKAGIAEPLITVAALNSHGGDNDLFGTKEIEQLVSAMEAVRAEGINAVGPMPADPVSHIDKSGKYDAILSPYHDQGHIACKILGSEKSITSILGLPLIRSSVDHGTVLDIVGKEIAGNISLIESTRVVAEYTVFMRKKTDQ